MKKMIMSILILPWVLNLMGTGVALSYEEIEVKEGGSLSGAVTLKGDIPKLEPITVTKNKEVCGETLPNQELVVNAKNKGVQYAVITIEGIAKGKKRPMGNTLITNQKCSFVPHVQTAVVPTPVEIINNDKVLHNTHAYFGEETAFNSAVPPIPGLKINKKLESAGLVRLKCDAHKWMFGYIVTANHPYVVVTNENGEFKITDVPPGKYKITVWSESLGGQETEATITAKQDTKVSFELSKK